MTEMKLDFRQAYEKTIKKWDNIITLMNRLRDQINYKCPMCTFQKELGFEPMDTEFTATPYFASWCKDCVFRLTEQTICGEGNSLYDKVNQFSYELDREIKHLHTRIRVLHYHIFPQPESTFLEEEE